MGPILIWLVVYDEQKKDKWVSGERERENGGENERGDEGGRERGTERERAGRERE